jgi:membrane protein DedA with SNARE-associated domain
VFNLISQVIARTGLWGVFLLMLIENLIPVIPSELILSLAGFQAARGQFNPVLGVAAATAGSTIGGCAWYGFGLWFGLDRLDRLAGRFGRWIPVTHDEIVQARRWFDRWGGLAVCLGRAIPVVRGVICIPPGMARMPFLRFLAFSTLGAFIWSCLLMGAGYILNAHYDAVRHWLNPFTDAFLALSLGLYAMKVIRYRRG